MQRNERQRKHTVINISIKASITVHLNPVSRTAHAFELVNLAKEITQADTTLAAHASGKLRLIAKQIKALRMKPG